MEPPTAKLHLLSSLLREAKPGLIAYSGGVDSAFLLWFAQQQFPGDFQGVLADSPSLKREELAAASDFARLHALPLRIIKTLELDNPDYTANPLNRCYYCKSELFQKLNDLALRENFRSICYGENADDAREVRPGQQAARELQVAAPLREAGLTKAEIRHLAREAGLTVADKPAQPCLSSRIPHGSAVTPEKLQAVETAEHFLTRSGFRICRVRHHGDKAFVQVAPGELPRLLELARSGALDKALQQAGFKEVEIDPAGYQGAALN